MTRASSIASWTAVAAIVLAAPTVLMSLTGGRFVNAFPFDLATGFFLALFLPIGVWFLFWEPVSFLIGRATDAEYCCTLSQGGQGDSLAMVSLGMHLPIMALVIGGLYFAHRLSPVAALIGFVCAYPAWFAGTHYAQKFATARYCPLHCAAPFPTSGLPIDDACRPGTLRWGPA